MMLVVCESVAIQNWFMKYMTNQICFSSILTDGKQNWLNEEFTLSPLLVSQLIQTRFLYFVSNFVFLSVHSVFF